MSDAVDRDAPVSGLELGAVPAPASASGSGDRIRAAVARALDDDAFVLAVDGALEAVAEHARLRAMDEDTFVERARAAYERVAMEHAPAGGIDL